MKNIEIGQRIKKRREELGISALEIAEQLNFTKATIYRYESGDIKAIKLPVIESIADILKVNPAWLIGKSEDKFVERAPDTSQNENDIRNEIEDMIRRLLEGGTLSYNNEPLAPNQRMSLVNNLEATIELVDKLQENKSQKHNKND